MYDFERHAGDEEPNETYERVQSDFAGAPLDALRIALRSGYDSKYRAQLAYEVPRNIDYAIDAIEDLIFASKHPDLIAWHYCGGRTPPPGVQLLLRDENGRLTTGKWTEHNGGGWVRKRASTGPVVSWCLMRFGKSA